MVWPSGGSSGQLSGAPVNVCECVMTVVSVGPYWLRSVAGVSCEKKADDRRGDAQLLAGGGHVAQVGQRRPG